MKNDDQKAKLPNMDMNNNPIWDVLDGKIEPRKKEKKKKLKKKSMPSIDENIDFYFSELEKEEQKENKPNNKKKPFSLFAIIMFLALIIVISFFALITFKYDRIKVQSDSMATQITTGDQILYQSDLGIHRFNVVVLRDGTKKELLRVIGMPGDKVSLSDDVLTINGAIYDEDYLKENYVDFKLQEKNRNKFYTEDFSVAELKDVNKSTLHVPENKYILLGDNRKKATDSRTVGFYDKEDIQGVAIMKIWPLFKIEPIK